MGCDIHMWAEVKKSPEQKWKAVKKYFYDGRNYDLFAILADVRNGRGFAGCDTGDGFNPINEPRGIPEDASDFYKKQVEEWDVDGHSHSWFTLAELKAFDWTQTTKHRGWVDVEQFKVFQAKGKPESWSGMVEGGMVKHISNAEMKRRIKENNFGVRDYYTLVEWKETYAESANEFLTETIPKLEKLFKLKNAYNVRIVFFFDN